MTSTAFNVAVPSSYRMQVAGGVLGVLLFSTGACGSGASPSAAEGEVTLKNWRAHPHITEIRAIYEAIQGERAKGLGTTGTRRFDYDSPECQATYPVRETSLWRDEAGRTRAYLVDRIGSHRESMRIERYYDQEGHLRFVLVNRFPGETRVYVGTDGAVLWAVSRDNGPDAIDPHDRDDWETRPSTAAEARVEFEGTAECPEVRHSR